MIFRAATPWKRPTTPCQGVLILVLAFAAVCWSFSPEGGNASELRRTAIVRAVEAARPAIVNIRGQKRLRKLSGGPLRNNGVQRVNGMGTGVILDPRGYILTNHHVIEDVARIQVTLADKRTKIARLLSHDKATDLALIKIDPGSKPLKVIRLGTSRDLMPGEPVVAVGNAYGYPHTVTRGIISALHRTVQVSEIHRYDDLIQTDADINPGNSGGPLLNIDGEMIGINAAVRVGAQGIGFAIPIDQVIKVAAELMSIERLEGRWHGIVARRKADGSAGLVIESVRPDSPAAEAKLKPGDHLDTAGGFALGRKLDLERAFLGLTEDDEVTLDIRRDGESLRIALTPSDMPDAPQRVVQRAWELLGLKLQPLKPRQVRQLGTRYRGGLAIVEVREESPADDQGVQTGDVLIGMHIWETISMKNVAYVLDRPDLTELEPIKFFILRDTQTLYGHLRIAQRRRTASK